MLKKKALTLIEAVRRWSYYLCGKCFDLVVDQRALSVVIDKTSKGKVKNKKIQLWRAELGCFDYCIYHHPGMEFQIPCNACTLLLVSTRDVEAVIFQPLPPPHLSLPLPHLSLPLPLTKNEKTTIDNFFNFCGSLACLLLHFIILRRQIPSFIAITLPASLEPIVSNYSVFLFLRY